ncbi:MAG: DUF3865 domain-containing protein [Cyanobacteria bacterium P01_F01_bin.86]
MFTFEELMRSLNTSMANDFLAVNPAKNPVTQLLYRGKFNELSYVVQQYAIFPKAIVDLMKLAEQKALKAGWYQVANELKENIAEELGSSTKGISHYDLLANGLEEGLQLPIKSVQPSAATKTLLAMLDRIFDKSAAHALGATYALEATSIPELSLVRQIIELLLEGDLSHDLKYFFEMHLNEWEPEHEEDLRRSLESYINADEFQAFSEGFQAVLGTMDVWWLQLTAEVKARDLVLQNV